MPQRRISGDDDLFIRLILIRRHFMACTQCRIAKKTRLFGDMCPAGLNAMFQACLIFDDLIRLRIKASNSGQPVIYPCPDLSRHGKSYALTAYPMHAVGVQNGLF